jgi:hypothetical protein
MYAHFIRLESALTRISAVADRRYKFAADTAAATTIARNTSTLDVAKAIAEYAG